MVTGSRDASVYSFAAGRSPVGTGRPVWWQRFRPNESAAVRLFCLPFAGGSASVFADWAPKLPPQVDVLGLQLPGRGVRMADRPVSDQQVLLDAILGEMRGLIDRPFVLFGHSMGARIAYELSVRLRDLGLPMPGALLLSAARPPHLPRSRGWVHDLPRAEFFNRLRELNGTADEVLACDELLDMIEPGLRADFRIVETWADARHTPLPIPIHALGGLHDEHVSPLDLAHWARHTSESFSVKTFAGGHFYIRQGDAGFVDWLRGFLASSDVVPEHAQVRSSSRAAR